jgi:hypothetical protein
MLKYRRFTHQPQKRRTNGTLVKWPSHRRTFHQNPILAIGFDPGVCVLARGQRPESFQASALVAQRFPF